jgi:hypothetical protein
VYGLDQQILEQSDCKEENKKQELGRSFSWLAFNDGIARERYYERRANKFQTIIPKVQNVNFREDSVETSPVEEVLTYTPTELDSPIEIINIASQPNYEKPKTHLPKSEFYPSNISSDIFSPPESSKYFQNTKFHFQNTKYIQEPSFSSDYFRPLSQEETPIEEQAYLAPTHYPIPHFPPNRTSDISLTPRDLKSIPK